MSNRETKPLTIAVVRPYLTLSKGGAERYASELVRGLVALGHSVHVFANQWDKPPEPGVTYHAVAMPRKPAWLRVLVFHWNLRRQLDLSAYDAVLGMTPFFPQSIFWLGDGLYAVWTRVSWPVPLVRWLMCLKRTVMAVNLWMERKMLCPATPQFIANSNLVKRQAIEHYGVSEDRITVVYPGVDMTRFHPSVSQQWRAAIRRQLGIGDEEIALLFVSNNFRRKGLDSLIRAFAELNDPTHRFRLIVVGAGRLVQARRLAQRLGVAQKITFEGRVEGIERYYGASDVFVLPTRYDPCAAACLEAMACGLPVVTTANNGASELIDDGVSGFILSASEPVRQLKGCLEKLLDSARCAAMGALAAARVESLTTESHVRQIAEVLGCAAGNRFARGSFRQVRPSPEIVVNGEFLSLLEQRGLASFLALMKGQGAREIFYNRSKRIYRFSLSDGKGSKIFFLKRHHQRLSLWEKFDLGRAKNASEGMREWGNILHFHQRGLPAVTPVAAGERILADGTQESFVMTLGLEDFVPVDQYITKRFPPPLDPTQFKAKRRVIEAVAQVSRRVHAAGFNHRDYYLCHIFIRDGADGAVDLRIIDLGRVGYRNFPRGRWLIKDLAQLHYSSLGLPLTDRDRLRFYAIYERREDTRRARRRQLRRILKKSAAMSRHDAKLRRSQLGGAVVAVVTKEESSGGSF